MRLRPPPPPPPRPPPPTSAAALFRLSFSSSLSVHARACFSVWCAGCLRTFLSHHRGRNISLRGGNPAGRLRRLSAPSLTLCLPQPPPPQPRTALRGSSSRPLKGWDPCVGLPSSSPSPLCVCVCARASPVSFFSARLCGAIHRLIPGSPPGPAVCLPLSPLFPRGPEAPGARARTLASLHARWGLASPPGACSPYRRSSA